jgi:hypothetical protein
MSEESVGPRRRKRKSKSKYVATLVRMPAPLFEAMRFAADREDMPMSMLQRIAMKRELRRLRVPIGGRAHERI